MPLFFSKNTPAFLVCLLVVLCLLGCRQNTAVQNRLNKASSPYLREHADNPVNWYEWGDEALAKAKQENKPLLISIGYAACHWCHQMEQESFMDTAVARLMNENFVCIKVDREERPDIDNLYMHACQLLNNGEAGWPLNAFALPDGKPFFAGTYYAKQNWVSLLQQIATAYTTKPKKVEMQAYSLSFGIADNDSLLINHQNQTKAGDKLYAQLHDELLQELDTVHGGLQSKAKFPVPAVWESLMQQYYFTHHQPSINIVNKTLSAMALSGLYDPVGGGFSRYTVDSAWHQPHFEKMLYDNAQLISVYAHAFQLTRNDLYRQTALETIAFVQRELSAPGGGFYCSLNADTEEGEGEFYTWTQPQLDELLAHSPVQQYFKIYTTGKSKSGVLYAEDEPAVFAKKHALSPEEMNTALAAAKQQMFITRNKRQHPSVDDKILVSWNALMIQAYADAYAAFGDVAFLQKALQAASFIEKNMMQANGELMRNYKDGKASVAGFLDDYSLLAKAFTRLYEVSFDSHWLYSADKMAQFCLNHFFDSKTGLFFFSNAAAEKLAVQKIEMFNSSLPPSNAVMAELLFSLSIWLDKPEYAQTSAAMMQKLVIRKGSVAAFAAWGQAMGKQVHALREVAIMGSNAGAINAALQKQFLPNCLFMGGHKEDIPLLQNKTPAAGTMIYVCTNKVCQRPTADVVTALQQIAPKM